MFRAVFRTAPSLPEEAGVKYVRRPSPNTTKSDGAGFIYEPGVASPVDETTQLGSPRGVAGSVDVADSLPRVTGRQHGGQESSPFGLGTTHPDGELQISQRLGGAGTAAVRPKANQPASAGYGVKAIANTASVDRRLQHGGEVRDPLPDLHPMDGEAHRRAHRAIAFLAVAFLMLFRFSTFTTGLVIRARREKGLNWFTGLAPKTTR
jgi:hypothetical protein